jgi:hypothetical protein
MASRFWVAGGTGNVNSTTNWSASSGGASGASAPGAGDDVFVDANSGSNAININAATSWHSLDTTGSLARSVTGSSGLTIGGLATLTTASVFKIVSNITWSATSNITWDNRSGGITITTNGVSFTNVGTMTTAANCSGTITLGDNFDIGATVWTINRGTLSVGSKTLSANGGSIITAGAGVKAIDWTGGTISPTTWTMGGTLANLTLTGNASSNLNVSGNSTFTGGAKSYPGTVTFGASAALATLADSGNTFVNLTWTGLTCQSTIDLNSCTVSGVLTLSGLDSKQYGNIESGSNATDAQVTITVNGSVSLNNVCFRGIVTAGTAGTWTGTNIGNRGNCTGITFDTTKTRYWVGGASGANFFQGNKWATTSGGSAGASSPLPQDTALFDNTGLTANSLTVTNDGTYWPIIDTSTLTRTGTILTVSGAKVTVIQACGNVTLGATTTLTMQNGSGNSVQWYKPSATITITMASGGSISTTSNTPHRIYSNVTTSGVCTFTTSPFQLYGGTLDLSSAACTFGGIQDSLANGTVIFGNNIHTLSGSGSNVFQLNTGASTTVTGADTSEFVLTDTTVTSKTIVLTKNAGATALVFKSITYLSGTGALITSGSGTINILALGPGVLFTPTSGTTVTMKHLDAIGKSGSNVSIRAVTAASPFTLSVAAGIINCDWLTLQDSTASGGATFYAGANSTNTSGNTGWSFTSGPARQQLSSMGVG